MKYAQKYNISNILCIFSIRLQEKSHAWISSECKIGANYAN